MPCSCLKDDFNIYVYNQDCKTLVIEDHSIWMEDYGYTYIPETMDVEITFPNGLQKTIEINPQSKNVIKSEELIEGTFKDGVYSFKTTSCEDNYTTYRLISCNAQKELAKLKATLNIDSPKEDWEKIWILEGYLEVAQSAAKYGQLEKTQSSIDLFYDEIQNLNCCS